MKGLRIGIDSYGLYPLRLSPLEALCWANENGAEGVQFSGFDLEENKKIDILYLKDMAQYAASHDMYLEWGGGQHIPFDINTWEKKDIFTINHKAAKEAATLGTRIIRSCSGGLMRWSEESPATGTLIHEIARSLRFQRQMLEDHDVILAIETHFEFTTHELLRLFEQCGAEPGDYLGICLDTMNLLTMLEEPVRAAERILPWVVSSHIKDGALFLTGDGMTTFPVRIGKGLINIRRVIEYMASLSHEVHLSIEDHGGSFFLPIFDPLFLAKFPDLNLHEFVALVRLALKAEKLRCAGQLQIVERENWPEICESRIKYDIQALRRLL